MIFGNILSSLLIIPWLSRLPLASAHETRASQNNGPKRTISNQTFNSLEELSRIVDVAYCVSTTGVQKPFECLSHCSDFEDFELITTWNTGPFLSDSCGYVALSHHPSRKRILVAFRGTYSIANTIIDLTAYPQEYVPYNPGGEEGARTPRCLNCTVHAGFLTSWRNTRSVILDHISAARDQYPDYDLVLVGHSLGGAVAALAGLELQLRGWEPQVTTFGEPKIGNKDFVEFVDEVFDLMTIPDDDDDQMRFRRVTHANDPVPLLPLQEWGYEMHAGEIFISKVDLPPSIGDVELCEGTHDPRCISGADEALEITLSEVNSILHDGPRQARPIEQAVLADNNPTLPLGSSQRGDAEDKQTPFSLSTSLIPARYRLWELFFAHRDYFWRLGLCVPGGDPTAKFV